MPRSRRCAPFALIDAHPPYPRVRTHAPRGCAPPYHEGAHLHTPRVRIDDLRECAPPRPWDGGLCLRGWGTLPTRMGDFACRDGGDYYGKPEFRRACPQQIRLWSLQTEDGGFTPTQVYVHIVRRLGIDALTCERDHSSHAAIVFLDRIYKIYRIS